MEKNAEEKEVSILVSGHVSIEGDLSVPQDAHGIILFAHGSGSGRYSPRNIYTASKLKNGGFATLLIDLLSQEEGMLDMKTAQFRFNIDLLASRLVSCIDWLVSQAELKDLAIGLYGASTGAAAAIITATERPDPVFAVVSRGGRIDMAAEAITRLKSPILVVIGDQDRDILSLSKPVFDKIKAPKKYAIIPGAGHLFEETGTLEMASQAALDWFSSSIERYKKGQTTGQAG